MRYLRNLFIGLFQELNEIIHERHQVKLDTQLCLISINQSIIVIIAIITFLNIKILSGNKLRVGEREGVRRDGVAG